MSQTLDVDAIKKRVEAASAGPWEPYDNYVHMPNVGAVEIDTGNPIDGDSSADTHFIAHARQDIPALIAEVERLRAAQGSEKHTAQCIEIALLLGRAGFPEDIPIQEAVRQLIQRVAAPQGEQEPLHCTIVTYHHGDGYQTEHDVTLYRQPISASAPLPAPTAK